MTASIAQATTLGSATPPLRPARLESRSVATAIDALITAALLAPFVALGGLTVLLQTDFLAVDPSGREWRWGYLVTALWLPALVAYHTLAAMRGASPGQRLLRLTVRDAAGAPPSARPALARALLHLAGLLLLGLATPLTVLDRQRRSPADRLTGTRVWEPAS